MTTKRQIAAWIKRLEKERDKVAKARDSLNEAVSEMEGLLDCCIEAHDSLNSAIDSLSELA